MRACSTGKWSGQERRAVGGGGIFIGASQESSHWAQIQISDKVRGEPDNVRLEVSVCEWIGKDLESLDSIIFHFIQHAPLSSMVFLYSRNIKTSCSTA
jgi:hypothetical protein